VPLGVHDLGVVAEVHPVGPQRVHPADRLAPRRRIACLTRRQVTVIGFQIQPALVGGVADKHLRAIVGAPFSGARADGELAAENIDGERVVTLSVSGLPGRITLYLLRQSPAARVPSTRLPENCRLQPRAPPRQLRGRYPMGSGPTHCLPTRALPEMRMTFLRRPTGAVLVISPYVVLQRRDIESKDQFLAFNCIVLPAALRNVPLVTAVIAVRLTRCRTHIRHSVIVTRCWPSAWTNASACGAIHLALFGETATQSHDH
jgi:hypothetical protein